MEIKKEDVNTEKPRSSELINNYFHDRIAFIYLNNFLLIFVISINTF